MAAGCEAGSGGVGEGCERLGGGVYFGVVAVNLHAVDSLCVGEGSAVGGCRGQCPCEVCLQLLVGGGGCLKVGRCGGSERHGGVFLDFETGDGEAFADLAVDVEEDVRAALGASDAADFHLFPIRLRVADVGQRVDGIGCEDGALGVGRGAVGVGIDVEV